MRLSLTGLAAMLVPLLALALGSCAGEETDGPVQAYLTDIATFEGNTPGGSVFTVRMMDDSPLATLRADRSVDCGRKPPVRMMIRYQPQNGRPYTDSDIRLSHASPVNSEPPVTDPATASRLLALFGRDPAEPVSVWRTGEYINIRMRLMECAEARTLALVLVPETAGTAEPEYRLVHALPAGAPPSYMRTAYASYDISYVWSDPSTRLVKISLNPGETFTFRRQ